VRERERERERSGSWKERITDVPGRYALQIVLLAYLRFNVLPGTQLVIGMNFIYLSADQLNILSIAWNNVKSGRFLQAI